jgi:zinc D-Ala-D-Ala dipeptidase
LLSIQKPLSPMYKLEIKKPKDIVLIKDYISTIKVSIKYATNDNFTGKPVPGYQAENAFLSLAAINNLKEIQKILLEKNLSLYVFDAYRPHQSVEYFMQQWRQSEECLTLKQDFHPHLTKNELFEHGFLASPSSHSRASTIDLSLFDLHKNQLLDMGSSFDYFDKISATTSPLITQQAQENRLLLVEVMSSYGFINYEKEWWHFRLEAEPYPGTLFDFIIN